MESGVLRLVDDPHPAATQLLNDAVMKRTPEANVTVTGVL